ncbi:MAG: transporter [Melioribacteraceae bacterium]|nr:transporter [Melioribacteraceae bacterium]
MYILKIKKIIAILLFITILSGVSFAQGKWYANTSLQVVGSDFQDGTRQNTLFLYSGVRYQTQESSLSLSLPIIYTKGNSFTQLNNSNIPKKGGGNSSNQIMDSSMNSIAIGLGDLYLNGSFQVIKETKTIPAFSIDGYVKFPTTTSSLGIGTGEFDSQIAVGVRKFVNRFSFFGQFGYLFLGDPEGAESINPFTVSLGIGYAFGYGEHSILLAYDSYTTIVQGIASPKQLALGYNYMIRKGFFFTSIISAGLNSSTSDYTISGGFNFQI